MRGLGARIALRAVPVALLTGGVVVLFAYAMTGAMLQSEGPGGEMVQVAREMGWRVGGLVAGLSFLAMALLEWLRWRREKLAPPTNPPPAK